VIGALRSVRARLTLWYLGALAVVLLAYAALVYVLVRGQLADQLDRYLHRDFEIATQALHILPGGEIGWREPKHLHPEMRIETDPMIELFDASGALVLRRTVHDLPASLGVSAPANAPREYFSLIANGVRLRLLEARLDLGAGNYTIRIVRSTEPLDRELSALFAWMALGLPAALALAGLLGWFVARRALAPVARMTAEARHISALKLSARMVVGNPGDELGRLAISFNDAFDRLERAFGQLSQFTSDAAHELRTPLTALKTVGEVALWTGNDASCREALASMLEEIERLASLVDGLLLLARASEGRLAAARAPVALEELAADTVALMQPLAAEKRQQIRVHAERGAQALGDRALLQQVLINLVDNALRHCPEGAQIMVSAFAGPADAVIEVTDDGPGIAPADRERVFDRFFRADASRARDERAGGYGLGLAIAHALVAAQGGRIVAGVAAEGGARFSVALPRASS
jgi:heavy metal sensor kinase